MLTVNFQFISHRAQARALLAFGLLVGWSLAAFSGFLLWRTSGVFETLQHWMMFGLHKHDWAQAHAWASLIAVLLTGVHLFVVRRCLGAYFRKVFTIWTKP